MKRKIKVTTTLKNNKVEFQGEQNERNLMHLDAQQKYKATTIKPKKGKGSYKRNKKGVHDENVY